MTEFILKTFHLEMTTVDGRKTTTNYPGDTTIEQLTREQDLATQFERVAKTVIYSLEHNNADRLVLSEWNRKDHEKWLSSIGKTHVPCNLLKNCP